MMAGALNNNNYNENKSAGVHPLKFTVWLFIISIIMMFAAFTSAYIVRRSEGNWQDFALPEGLLINTILILLSSAALQSAILPQRRIT